MKRNLAILLIGFLALHLLSACSDDSSGANGNDNGSDGADGDADGDSDGDGDGDSDGDSDGDEDSDSSSDDVTDDEICEMVEQNASIGPVYLAFAFDVSGSMGQGDKEWHDQTLKWDPVVAAATAFLNNPSSSGYFANMTFFPADSGDKCDADSYLASDVPFVELPSEDFQTALDVIPEEEWRGGTPTQFVLRGVLAQVEEYRQEQPGQYAIVLVTDGYPEGCDDDSIESVVEVAEEATAAGVSTYVIGVNNPPIAGAPDTMSNLGDIAVGGGTGDAFLIDTGDPAQTSAAFEAAISEIGASAFSCEIDIPAPPENMTFDKQRVRVTVTVDGETTELVYDAACEKENSWRYDDVDDPAQIVLCDSTCQMVQVAVEPELQVGFACENLIILE